jgi:site-specific recombinase XerD
MNLFLATLTLSTGIDVYLVSKLLGHQSVKQTEVYLKIVNQQLDAPETTDLYASRPSSRPI